MNTSFLIKARKHFACGNRRIDRHNIRAWIKSLRFLGDKWLLATPATRTRTTS